MFLASSSSSSSSGSGAAGRAPAARRLAAARAATITANEDRNARTCTGCNLTFHVDHFSPDQLRRGGAGLCSVCTSDVADFEDTLPDAPDHVNEMSEHEIEYRRSLADHDNYFYIDGQPPVKKARYVRDLFRLNQVTMSTDRTNRVQHKSKGGNTDVKVERAALRHILCHPYATGIRTERLRQR